MKRFTISGRLALLMVAVVAMLVALPATAFAAKATTKIVIPKTLLANHDTQTTGLWPEATTAKLQKKSGSKYVGLKGTVTYWWWDVNAGDNGAYVSKHTSKSSSSGTFAVSFGHRGKYKMTFSGSSTTKACTAYTYVYESVGAELTELTPSLELVGSTYYAVIRLGVTWNQAATDWFDDTMMVSNMNVLESDIDDPNYTRGPLRFQDHEMFEPSDSVEFRYKIAGYEADLASMYSTCRATGFSDSYILGPEDPTTIEWTVIKPL